MLVGWDGSADAEVALRCAAAIVGDGPGHVVAVSVLADLPRREADNDMPSERPAQNRRVAEAFEAARSAIAKTSSVRIDLHTIQSRRVADAVCDYAAEHGFDLLVVGRHGVGGMIHPKLGHVAATAARECAIPVLLVSAG